MRQQLRVAGRATNERQQRRPLRWVQQLPKRVRCRLHHLGGNALAHLHASVGNEDGAVRVDAHEGDLATALAKEPA